MSLAPGTRIGAYEIQSPLGAGGMGEVYRARDTKLGRQVAVKILPDDFLKDPARVARFQREAQALAALNHPHIAQIYGFDDTSDVHALVMELVDGPTLADRIAQGPIPLDEALPIARQLAEALEAAHEQGIIHRDLKPANIKVRPDGTVKVLDFGLAKLVDADAVGTSGVSQFPTITSPAMTTGAGMLLGTAAYMSPEQAMGKAVDRRADLWAFGCVLFEMLTGRRAFDGATVTETLANVLKEEADWAALPSNIPPALKRLLRRCLVKASRSRIHHAADVRIEIEDMLASQTRHEAASRAVNVARWRPLVASAAAVSLVAAAIAIGVFGMRGRETASGTAAVNRLPLVIMMDSPHPARVYDPEVLAANGTNADVISDILSDLPIQRQKEAINPDWHRDEEIRQFDPDLIVIHWSGFNAGDISGPRERLKAFISFFGRSDTRFLIYSRAREDDLRRGVSMLLADVYAMHPDLERRIRPFGLLDYGPPRWINTVTGTRLKLAVKELLMLP